MPQSFLRYDKMVEEALRNVVRRALTQVAQEGLPAEHHFYVTFDTTFPGVELPEYLHQRYPSEMTIVLQHQFYGLKILDQVFQVTLSFNNTPERLVIPFEAIRIFADPSVSFALQFEGPYEDADSTDDSASDDFDEAALDALIAETEKALAERSKSSNGSNSKDKLPLTPSGKKDAKTKRVDESESKKGEIVSLADFRKKQIDKKE